MSKERDLDSSDNSADLLRNPENFLSLILLPQLNDKWTRVDLGRSSDNSWEVYLHVRLDGRYRSRLEAEGVAAYYQENLNAYLKQAGSRTRMWRIIRTAAQAMIHRFDEGKSRN